MKNEESKRKMSITITLFILKQCVRDTFLLDSYLMGYFKKILNIKICKYQMEIRIKKEALKC